MNSLKTKNLGTKEEFDEGIAKVKLLRVKYASEFSKLHILLCRVLLNIFIMVVQ